MRDGVQGVGMRGFVVHCRSHGRSRRPGDVDREHRVSTARQFCAYRGASQGPSGGRSGVGGGLGGLRLEKGGVGSETVDWGHGDGECTPTRSRASVAAATHGSAVSPEGGRR